MKKETRRTKLMRKERERTEFEVKSKDKYNCHCYLIQLDLGDSRSPSQIEQKMKKIHIVT